MSDLTQLYQEIILGHNKLPRNYGALEEPFLKAEGNNPLCGDEITVYWKLLDGNIADISFDAQGCAISRASASMMTELLKGKSEEEAVALFAGLKKFLESDESTETVCEVFGDLAALVGVRKYPSRIRCATLAWNTLIDKK